MALELRKAERRKTKARIGISGPAGSGKTMSALLMAYGLVGDWNKIAIIDTEIDRLGKFFGINPYELLKEVENDGKQNSGETIKGNGSLPLRPEMR